MTLPVRLDIFEPDGRKVADDFMVLLQRNHGVVVVLDAVLPAGALAEGRHVDRVYDFATAAKPTAGCTRSSEPRIATAGHVAESSRKAQGGERIVDL